MKEINYCCSSMMYHSKFKCDIHKDPFDCPDKIIFESNENKDIGIIIHDGGSSYISISFCPWCGKKITK